MSQIPDLLDDFNAAMAALKQKLDTPQVSPKEEALSQELNAASQKMTSLETDLETQKTNYQTLSEEFGEMELNLLKIQQDDSANNEISELEGKLSGLTAASEEKIAQLRTENDDLSAKLDIASSKQAALETELKATHSNALDDIKQQHSQDIAQVQDILSQLKPLVEE